jgi:hypothetical protein
MKPTLFVVGILLTTVSCYAQDWVLSKNKNGIQVYTKKSENSPIKAFRVVTTVQDGIDEILKVLCDASSYASWYDHCKKSEVISKEGERTIYYVEMSMPFPFDNRDVVYEMTVRQNETSVEIRYQALKGIKEEENGLVRMGYAKGSWIVSSTDGAKTTIEHEFEGDPEGNVPSGIVNLFIEQGPLNTIERLKEYIRTK